MAGRLSQRTFLILMVVILALGCLVFPIACDDTDESSSSPGSLVGKWVEKGKPANYIELKSNGKYYAWDEGTGYEGEWSVDGNEVTISWMGFASKYTLHGNEMTDEDGQTLVRK